MANTALLQVRIDPKTKTRAEKFFKRFGLSTSDGVRLLINQTLMSKEFPHVPNAETRRALLADVKPMADDELDAMWGDV